MSSSSLNDAPLAEGNGMRYAVAIWVEGAALPEVDLLRRLWDNQHDSVAAHITVVYPRQPYARRELSSTARNERHERPPPSWCASTGGQTSRVFGSSIVSERTIWRTRTRASPMRLSSCPQRGRRKSSRCDGGSTTRSSSHPRSSTIPPFLTIGQGLDDEESSAAETSLARYRPDLAVEVRAFDLLREDDAGTFSTLRTLALEG